MRSRGGWPVTRRGLLFSLICLALLPLGCGSGDDVDITWASDSDSQKSVRTSLIEKGRVAYGNYCIGCHGVEGDGKGEAAVFLNPKPRDFQRAGYKFSSTRAGLLPTNDDLRRTILGGLKGSAMPAYPLLPRRTVDALIAYVKSFSPKWEQRRPASVIPIVDDPYRADADKTEAIARGAVVYHGFATCWTCHPSYVVASKINEHLGTMENTPRDRFRDGLFESVGTPNAENETIYPPDFKRDFLRAGADVSILYRSIAAGITGTTMPTWADSIDLPSTKDPSQPLVQPADLWALAYYVQDLALQRPAMLTEGSFTVRHRARPIYLHGEPPPAPSDSDEAFLGEESFSEDDE